MTTQEKLQIVLKAADDIKAERIETVTLEGKSLIADFFVLCSGNSDTHIRAIVDRIDEAVSKAGSKGGKLEGGPNSVWQLLDLGDIVVHVMRDEHRRLYNLEELWAIAPKRDDIPTEE